AIAWLSLNDRQDCCEGPMEQGDRVVLPSGRPTLGLMSGLPLYWPLDASFDQIAQGSYDPPWFRDRVEAHYELIPVDTLSPIAPLVEGGEQSDPLKGIERLAIIQPRGLSPQDNVALDNWVSAGGHLLLALDPALTGHYEVPIGDPRHPSVTALIPPVLAKWGMKIVFDEDQSQELGFDAVMGREFPVHLAGKIGVDETSCEASGQGAIVRCPVGEGYVTVIADAAIFEHAELAGLNGEVVIALMDYAFQ
ncbi:MAG: hypothetical protein SXU28_06375, partial [Pseudomonadota bacterium]|nr:hypothetical protein [Pseudomonadota bacterium]